MSLITPAGLGHLPCLTPTGAKPILRKIGHCPTYQISRNPIQAQLHTYRIWNRGHQRTLIRLMDNILTRGLYTSSNGDRWHLCKEASGRVFIVYQANLPSVGHVSRIELAEFLSLVNGPEQQSLLRLIGTLLDRAPEHLQWLAVREERAGQAWCP